MWEIVTTEEFSLWWAELDEEVRECVSHDVRVIGAFGPHARRPVVDTVAGSRHSNLKELRTRCYRMQLRVFFAFDPRRRAVRLIGGDKSGDSRFYETMIPRADAIFDRYLSELEEERQGHESK
jgi:hypothetical protein